MRGTHRQGNTEDELVAVALIHDEEYLIPRTSSEKLHFKGLCAAGQPRGKHSFDLLLVQHIVWPFRFGAAPRLANPEHFFGAAVLSRRPPSVDVS